MSEKVKPGSFLRALAAILVADARRKGAVGNLYLGSIKLPDDGFRFVEGKLVHKKVNSQE